MTAVRTGDSLRCQLVNADHRTNLVRTEIHLLFTLLSLRWVNKLGAPQCNLVWHAPGPTSLTRQ
jgi:hypothetical protein